MNSTLKEIGKFFLLVIAAVLLIVLSFVLVAFVGISYARMTHETLPMGIAWAIVTIFPSFFSGMLMGRMQQGREVIVWYISLFILMIPVLLEFYIFLGLVGIGFDNALGYLFLGWLIFPIVGIYAEKLLAIYLPRLISRERARY